MAASSVPAVLEADILAAAKRYGVPHDLLEGIWRVESGSTYPNPAVNSEGYGGLFGTKDAYGPTQEQANLAASILASDLRMAGGSVAGGLSWYSGGGGHVPPSAGYDQVPGETTFGHVTVSPGSAAPPVITGAAPGAVGPTPAVSPSPQPVSLTSTIAGDLTGSVREAVIRLAEIALALFLGYLGLKALAAAFGGRPQTIIDAASFSGRTLNTPARVGASIGSA